MSTQVLFKQKLEKMLFLEVNIKALNKVFNIDIKEELYLPIQSDIVVTEAKKEKAFEKINIADFILGMFFVMGCDPNFTYVSLYKKILCSNEDLSKKVAKKEIYEKIQNEYYLDAYLLLKGLSFIEPSEDVFDKLLLLADGLRRNEKDFEDEMNDSIKNAKEANVKSAYYYEALMLFDESEYEKAKTSLDSYISLGGVKDDALKTFEEGLSYAINYKTGKDMLYENPQEALIKLVPLLEVQKDDPVLYYHIGVAYRLVQNYEKAIFYLNEALHLDKEFVDVVNEIGLSYACLGEYEEALKYFLKVFEASNAIEVCTNIIMTYINMNNMKKANEYVEIGKKINPNDEIFIEIQEKVYKNN